MVKIIRIYIYISCFLSGFSNYWNFLWFTYERLLFPCFFLYVYKRVNFQSTVIYIYIYYFNSWFITWIFMMFQWFSHRLFMRNTTHNCSSLGCCQSLGVLFNTPRPVAGKFLLGCKPNHVPAIVMLEYIEYWKKHITRFGICLNIHIVSNSGWL